MTFLDEAANREPGTDNGIYTSLMPQQTQPKSVKVHKSTGAGVDIEWNDGHQSHYSFTYLRDACPCALCIEEREKAHRKPGDPVAPVAGALPMFKALARPTAVEGVGNYAVRFTWNDGHQHGIFSWEWLREICPCEQCKMAHESTSGLQEDIAEHERRKPN
jgi:DUF971 family protein